MADNTRLNANTTVGDLYASDDIGGVKHTRVKVGYGDDGSATDVSKVNPLPALTHATTHPGNVVPLTANAEGELAVHFGTSVSSFGDAITVDPLPSIQLLFPYSVDTANVIQFATTDAGVTSINSQVVVNSGTTPGGAAFVRSKDFLIYKPGFGATCRFSFGVTTAGNLAGSTQQAGLGDAEDGFTFSYQNNDMSIMRSQNGAQNQWELIITTAASSSGNVTVELDGVSFTVPVTDASGSGNATAAEIAADSQFIPDFIVSAEGNAITFQNSRTGVRAGAFSFDPGSTGAVSSAGQTKVVGKAPDIFVTARADWNIDKCDGTGPQMPIIDWSKGNIFQIRYQWLGYGAQSYYVENPNSGNMVLVHRTLYSNTAVVPSIFNPSLQFLLFCTNGPLPTDVACFCASAYAGIDGGEAGLFGTRHADIYSGTVSSTQFDNIVSFCAPRSFKGKTNRTEVSLIRMSITSSAAADILIVKGATLGGTADWTEVEANTLLVFDQSSTTVTGGHIEWAERAEQKDRFVIEPVASGFTEIVTVYPGDVVSIAGQADGGSSNISVAINWIEPV